MRRFLNQKNRWPLEEAEQILKALGIVIESKSDGAPHGKVRYNERHHTLSSKLLKDGQVYARYLHEWIVTLGREPARLPSFWNQNDPRLAPYMRKSGRRGGMIRRPHKPGAQARENPVELFACASGLCNPVNNPG